jgi:hypothetical protein
MKSALFTWKSSRSRTTIRGQVTLKDDGKTSISLFNVKYGTSAAERYQAKQLANEIVASNFKHEAAENVVENIYPDGLVKDLTDKTQELKEAYINEVKIWAKRHFAYCETLKKRTHLEWLDAYGITYKLVDKYGQKNYPEVDRKMYGDKLTDMRNHLMRVTDVIDMGFEKFEAKEIKDAEAHYNQSIAKLAYRLNQKGIVDGSQFVVTTARLGRNLEITIKHGDQVTRAFTIWAEGEVNRPHYRYLVK